MKILFTELEPTVRGTSNGMLIKGTKTYDNSDYEKFYWDKTQSGDVTPLHKIALTLKAGDEVELTYDDTKFKNLKEIIVNGSGGGSAAPASGGAKKSSPARSGGGARSNFRDPDHTDRSSAMYLAWDIVSKMMGIDEKKPTAKTSPSILAQFEDMAKKLERFLHTGDFEAPSPAANETGNDADPLASQAPEDDIPF